MDSKEIGRITETIQKKYPEANIQKIEWDQPAGKASFFLKPSQQLLASLPVDKAVRIRTAPELAATLRRDVIDRSVLDLVGKSPHEEDPKEIFTKAIKYYYENDVYGINI